MGSSQVNSTAKKAQVVFAKVKFLNVATPKKESGVSEKCIHIFHERSF
jgi:hypothetical protein